MIHLKYFLQIVLSADGYIEILEDETKIGGSQNLRVAYKLYIFVMK